jgi:hypothetical protein
MTTKRSKHARPNRINRSRKYMKGGDVSHVIPYMLGNILAVLEHQFPESYRRAQEEPRWFYWRRHGWTQARDQSQFNQHLDPQRYPAPAVPKAEVAWRLDSSTDKA